MVIIEVDREFKRTDALLGMHSWSEFLLAPTKEEAGKSSKVFYCTYDNGKAVKDAGGRAVALTDVVLLIQFVAGNRYRMESR
jgi:hypothetical protein